jgi:GT2 family glycosyltransferase
MKSLSLVMTYHNRPQQTLITLKSIEHLCQNKEDLEIIIVDDASDPQFRVKSILSEVDLPIEVICISKEEHWWINPCVPFNIGIRAAKGDIIALQTPECVHMSADILNYFREKVTEDNYLISHCCLSLTGISYQYPTFPSFEDAAVAFAMANQQQICWSDRKYHFLSAMSRTNMEKLGGFDETFADGYAYDDDEFLFRAEESGLDVRFIGIEHGFVIHQLHSKNPKYSGGCPEWLKNQERYRQLVNGKRVVH